MAPTKQRTLILTLVIAGLTSCKQKQSTEIRESFSTYYNEFKVEGSFALYDLNQDKFILYNPEQYRQEFSPASTFKICNSLIGLETGVIKDENFLIPWDSVNRDYHMWNSDHDLKTAFQNSTVWYYQELARRVGGEQMKSWLDKTNYGNADTSGGIDKFWLSGGLRITPEQQIDFLTRLYSNKLPFSQRSMDIVKEIMIVKGTGGYTLRAKTGWADRENRMVGWYVGYIEKGKEVYFFVNCIQTSDINNPHFANARKDIANAILKELKLIVE